MKSLCSAPLQVHTPFHAHRAKNDISVLSGILSMMIIRPFLQHVWIFVLDSACPGQLTPEVFHIRHILCGGPFTAVTEINFSIICHLD